MNLKRLFEMQKMLDDRIVKKHGLEDKDLMPNLILALLVELGELANEWQGFKHWKVEPRPKDGMLEEYVDCLHFILSIGNWLEFSNEFVMYNEKNIVMLDNITDQFNELFDRIGVFSRYKRIGFYWDVIDAFLGLGQMLDFTWEQIEQAYMAKNAKNHDRQANGY